MKIRFIAIAVVAVLSTSAAFAGSAPAVKAVEGQPAPRAQTLLEDIAAGMRQVLRSVTPEVSLPKIEITLPTLQGAAR